MFLTLMYHIVDHLIWSEIAVSEQAFDAQLAHLRTEAYNVLGLDDVLEIVAGNARAPERGLFITFDDGYADNLFAAMPRLREYGVEATLFVPTAVVGQSNHWNAPASAGLRHMDWNELERWLEGGGRIGGHTHGHESAREANRDEWRRSIECNRRLLHERLGVQPQAFSYPNGVVTRAGRSEVARHYEVAWTVTGGTWQPQRDRYRLNRYGVGRHVGVDEFAWVIDDIFEGFDSTRTRLRPRIRGGVPPPPSPGPRVALVAEAGAEDLAYPATARFADLLAAGLDVHLVRAEGAFHDHVFDDLPDDVVRLRIHPPTERLQPLLPRANLVLGLARAFGRRPIATVRSLLTPSGGGVRYLRAVLHGLQPDVVHLRADSSESWRLFGAALGASLVIEKDGTGAEAIGVAGGTESEQPTVAGRGVEPSLLELDDPGVSTCLHVLAIGPLSWAQGYEHLMHALALLGDRGVAAACRIVGSGDHEDALRFARHQLALDDVVELYRPGRRPALEDHIRWAHVLVNSALEPAVPWWLIHAQAAARPLVTTPLPDGQEMPGIVVPPGDAEALASGLELLASDRAVISRLAREGRRRALALPSTAVQLAALRTTYHGAVQQPRNP